MRSTPPAGMPTATRARSPPHTRAVCNTTLLLVRENRAWPLYVSIKTYVWCA